MVQFITTALKSSPKLVKLQSLVAKCCKMRKIYPCEVCKFCIFWYYGRKIINPFLDRGINLPCVILKLFAVKTRSYNIRSL